MIKQIGGERKYICSFCGEFAGALLDSSCGGSDCDLRPLLRQQTSSCEAYPLRAARACDERHFSRKVHRFGPHTSRVSLHSTTAKMTMKTKTLPMVIMKNHWGDLFAGIISGAETHFGKPDCTSLHAAVSNIKYGSPALCTGRRAHRLLASARRTQHIVKGRIWANFCEKRIGEQILVRAIILPDRALEQMKSRLFLATVREQSSL